MSAKTIPVMISRREIWIFDVIGRGDKKDIANEIVNSLREMGVKPFEITLDLDVNSGYWKGLAEVEVN